MGSSLILKNLMKGLLFVVCFLTCCFAYQVIRPQSANIGDLYDRGIFVYNGQVVTIDCRNANIDGERCRCYAGRTFLLSETFIPMCIADYGLADLGCQFRFDDGNNYVAVAPPDKMIGTVKYGYNSVKDLSIIKINTWNMTWQSLPTNLFGTSKNAISWNNLSVMDEYSGALLRIHVQARQNKMLTAGCLLLKVPGTRNYPLMPYVSRTIAPSISLTVLPTTSDAPTSPPISSSSIVSRKTTELPTAPTSIVTTTLIQKSTVYISPMASPRESLRPSHLASSMIIRPPLVTETKGKGKTNVAAVVGGTIGASLLIAVIVVLILLYRRNKLCANRKGRSEDTSRLNGSTRSSERTDKAANGPHGGDESKKNIGNPVYEDGIRLNSVSPNRGLSLDLYDYAYENNPTRNEPANQVYSEVGKDRPVEPIYREVVEDGAVYEDAGSGYQKIDEKGFERSSGYQSLDKSTIKHKYPATSPPQSPVYQEVEEEKRVKPEPQSPVYQTIEPEKQGNSFGGHGKNDDVKISGKEAIYHELEDEGMRI